MSRLSAAIASSLRYKLLLLVALPIALVVPALIAGSVIWSRNFSYDQLFQRVTTDLAVAADSFQRIQQDYLGALESVGESHILHTSLQTNDDEQLLAIIELLSITHEFDFIHLTDAVGNWRFPNGRDQARSPDSPLLDRTRRWGLPSYGVEIYTQDQLAGFDAGLAERARIELQGSPDASPTTRRLEDRALVLRAIYPVKDDNGTILALLDGGVMLNRNFSFVDRLRDLVYGPGSLPEGGKGAVSVSLGDVRISTNIRLDDDNRALGTRVAGTTAEAVMARGEQRVGRSRVVAQPYIAAYQPIVSSAGERVGMLNTSILEAPWLNAYLQAVFVLGGALLITTGLLTLLLIRGAAIVLRPIESMLQVVRSIKAGKDRRIGAIGSADELGELAREFDTMLELLAEQDRRIRSAADNLEQQVAERTSELRDKNDELHATIDLLQETRQQLAVAEKLAALGELTAGVAHEINNPVAVILGNLDILVRDLGSHAAPVQTEIDLITAQIDRIRTIVERLLRYARPAQYAGKLTSLDPARAIDDTLTLVNHELARNQARIVREFDEVPSIVISYQELQQVLVNLLLNAAQAIEPQGLITVGLRRWSTIGVVISVRDNGRGIARDDLQRVFDPFYTTRQRGTGLGLSVSYGIVRHYGGRIAVASEEGAWTRFDLYLRCDPDITQADPQGPVAQAAGLSIGK